MTEPPDLNDSDALSTDKDKAWESLEDTLTDAQVLRGLIEDLKVAFPSIKAYTLLLKDQLSKETISTEEAIHYLNRIAAISTSATELVNEALDSRRKHWKSSSE